MASNSSLIRKSWTTMAQSADDYRDNWMCDETWFRILNIHYPALKNSFKFTREGMNRALGALAGSFDSSNSGGIYRKDFKTICPYDGSRRTVWFYYYRSEGEASPRQPVEATDCHDSHATSHQLQHNRLRVPTAERERRENDDVSKAAARKIENQQNKKSSVSSKTPRKGSASARNDANEITPPRGQDRADAARENDDSAGEVGESGGGTDDAGGGGAQPAPDDIPIYWDSPEAAKLFGFTSEEDDVYYLLKKRIAVLSAYIGTHDGYKNVVTHNGVHLSPHFVFTMRNKCLFLRMAYKIAVEKMGRMGDDGKPYQWVRDCCKPAVERINGIGIDTTCNAIVLQKWNVIFRREGMFPHPNPYIVNGLKPKPLIFDWYPEAAALASEFVLDKLEIFSIEMLRSEFITKILPGLLDKAKADGVDPNSAEYKFLQEKIDKPPSHMTVNRWVRYLGFKLGPKAKTYYVDGHEHPAQLKHRSEMTEEYLTVIEPRTHRWVQLTKGQFEAMQQSLPEKKKIVQSGYTYEATTTGAEMIEFHVDDHDCLQEYANNMSSEVAELGGCVSVRMPAGTKPIVIFGQDESVFNQFSFNGLQWIGPDGQRSLLPKNKGVGKMVSAFVSRTTGFGMEISADQLKKINDKRKRDGEYFDKNAATAVLNTTKKHALTESPFVRLFEFGGANGYWTGNHMVVQTEDCIDCLDVIFEGKYDFVMLYDHSSGHAKKRADGLDVKSMNVNWGGKVLRKTLIKEKDGYLGPFHDPMNARMVQVGQEQTLVYSSQNDLQWGPFNLTEAAREARRHDVEEALPTDKQGKRNKTKDELVADLIDTDYGKAEGEIVLSRKLLRDLQKKARALNIDTKKMVTHKKRIGWENQGKGLLQVLFERGWINVDEISKYKKRVEDEDGNLIPGYSLVHLMEQCTDFANEVSQLEYVCQSLGARAMITTKYHAEYAGEGVEYCWGHSKAVYRRYPLAAKKGKDNFDKLVAKCISPDTLTKDLVRKFSKRARGYMVTYKMLELKEGNAQPQLFSQHKIESMKKIIKSHRAALDFDKAFIMSNVSVKDFSFEEEVEQKSEAKRAGKKRKRST